jgi:ligand-binding sensor domain-containing protein
MNLVEGRDIRFRRLSGSAGLSQTRVSNVVQDSMGFIWFGTQSGLNRYDGYQTKVFKHEPGRQESLSCVYIRSLFVDHFGALWVGCERSLDKYDPVSETFSHYRYDTDPYGSLPAPVAQISEDRSGKLWLATLRGLYRVDPITGQATRYGHDPADPTSISGNVVRFTGEDRTGQFWIATTGGLDAFDRDTGKVLRHVPFRPEIGQFHQDKFGVFWISSTSSSCPLATMNLVTYQVTCYSLYYPSMGGNLPVRIYEMLESRDGTLWMASVGAGLLKFDRAHNQVISYRSHTSDNESLGSDNVVSLFEDKEQNIWICLQEGEPNFFAESPQAFVNFTYRQGSLVDALVTAIYEDHHGILWIGSMAGLNRIDRRTGGNTVAPGSRAGNEILSILEDRSGTLLAGTYHQGLQRLDPETGELRPYVSSRGPSNLDKNPIMRLTYDHQGTLWAATYGSVSRFDPATGNFIMYTPDQKNAIQYQEIKIDSNGFLWLGTQSGLHRFDPRTGQFTIYMYDPDNPHSLSDNRVNGIYFDESGALWVGTQNGLDKYNPDSGSFKVYYEQDGLAGNVVSCILEDDRKRLWMSTNKGLSRFDLQTGTFENFYVADGLPGPNLTGWSSCFQSQAGEMFFGGFSGATAFFPERIGESSFVPRTVLTDLRLSGDIVPVGHGSFLNHSLTYTDTITLSHQQNIFSIEFSALSYFNPEANRYRYRLKGLDSSWHKVGSNQRIASYTTLPVGKYDFEVQGATSRGMWSEPGARLRIVILPPWWGSIWFRVLYCSLIALMVWITYRYRLGTIAREYSLRLEERVNERTRMARELHDTMLQSFQGLMMKLYTLTSVLDRPAEAHEKLKGLLQEGQQAIDEGRNAVRGMRSSTVIQNDLARGLTMVGEGLAAEQNAQSPVDFRVVVEGESRDMHPILRDEVYRIASEAMCNAFRHSGATRIEIEICYDKKQLRVRVQDNGKGIDPRVLDGGGREGHYGLPGMRERAKLAGGKLTVWSKLDSGTEIELIIPASRVYAKSF